MEQNLLNDDELNKILNMATKPEPLQGFEQRLLMRISNHNVIAFPQRKKPNAWLIGLPLAASLALGLWLGAAGLSSGILSTTNSTLMSENIGDTTNTGFDDVTQFIEDSLT